MKRLFAIILTIALITVLLAGCKETPPTSTSASASSSSAVVAPQKVKWMIVEYSIIKYMNDLKIYEKIEKAGNIELEIIPSPLDSYNEKFNTMIASKEMPDVIQTYQNYEAVKEYGPKGLFVPISDKLDLMPNLKKWMDKYSASLPGLRAGDGKVYCMPKVKDYSPIMQGVAMRGDLLEKGGYDVKNIKTMDDLYAAFKVLQTQNGGKPILSARSGLKNLETFAQSFGTKFNSVYYDFDKKQYINPIATKNCKDAVQFFVNMKNDKLLHPDWASMSDKDWESRVNTGELMGYFDNMQNLDNFYTTNIAKDPKFTGFMIGVVPPSYNGKTYTWGRKANLLSDWAPVVNAKSTAINSILKAWDFFYNDANYDWINYGDEGVTSTKSSDGTYWVYKDKRSPEVLKLITDVYGIGQNENFYTVMKVDTFYNWAFNTKNTRFQTAVEAYEKTVYTALDPLNLMQFTSAELASLKNTKTPVDTWITENLTKFINGVRPMSEWDKFVTEVNGMNVDAVVKTYNDALGRVK